MRRMESKPTYTALDVRQIDGRWWVCIDGTPYRWAKPHEIPMTLDAALETVRRVAQSVNSTL